MKIGIVGLPNAGKSTLFNALTRAGAETGDYAFTTIDPNVAVVGVPDRAPRAGRRDGRLERGGPGDDRVPRHRRARSRAPRRARAWATSSWPRSARPTRSATSSASTTAAASRTPRGGSTRSRDIELIETELLAADLEQAERRLERVTKQARSQDKEAIAERDWLEQVVEALGSGRPVRDVPVPDAAKEAPRRLFALTSKPVLYVANVDEGDDEVPEAIAEHARAAGAARSRSRPGSRPSSASSTRPRRTRCGPSSGSPSPAWRG